MKRNIKIILMLGIMTFGITGCVSFKKDMPKKMLICSNDKEKYVFNFDKNKESIGIYYEKVFDFNYYYTERELKELKETGSINYIILEQMMDCSNLGYACNSIYKDDKIINKIYLKNSEEASKANLNSYYGINYIDLRTRIVSETDVVCEEINEDSNYIFNGNVNKIIPNHENINS